MTAAVLKLSPVEAPAAVLPIERRMSIADILEACEAPAWFWQVGVVRLDGHPIPREMWQRVRVKPDRDSVLELCVVPQGKNTLALLATVATIALAASVSGGLLGGLLGSSFAAGGLGASAAAAGIGLAGQLLVAALTAPPKAKGPEQGKEQSLAGISGNTVPLLGTLPVILGKIGGSPPLLAPPYTTLEGDELTVHAVVGVEGRCLIENVKINGTDSALIERLQIETREGAAGEAARTIANQTVIQQRDGVALSAFRTVLVSNKNDKLLDQATPGNSVPNWHYFKTDGAVDEVWFQLLFPGGIVDTTGGNVGMVPIRLEARKVGDVSWRKFPTIHCRDGRHGSGLVRTQVKIKWQTQPSGIHYSDAMGEYPVAELTNITGRTQTYEYQSDAYFQNNVNINTVGEIPAMTAATTSGVTMSASSEFSATYAAWKASDNNTSTFWRPAANSLPGWIKIDFGAAKTIRSYRFYSDRSTPGATPNTAPTVWYWEGSNDDVNWTRLDAQDVDTSDFITQAVIGQIGTPGSYRYYRLNVVANNGANNEDLQITHLQLFTFDAIGSALNLTSWDGDAAIHASVGYARCVYGSLDANGATFYLDPAQWEPGQWEFRLKRGLAFAETNFDPVDYSWGGSAAQSDFFEYRMNSGEYVVRVGQKNFRSDTQIEAFSSVNYDPPFDPSGIALIAVSAPNTQIDSIYAEFTRYAPSFDGTIWSEAQTPTQNPAALYRQQLLGGANLNPVPGEIVDEVALGAWYTRCAAAGHQCNAIMDGRSLADVLQVIAAAGYGSPRMANLWSVVEDNDTTGDPITQLLTPLNSRDLGTEIAYPDVPHAIRAEFFDEADDYKVAHTMVYRDGYSAGTASLIETVTYDGFTDAGKVAARAAFDLKQATLRSERFTREIGLEGYTIQRGDLVGLTDDVLEAPQCYALIKTVHTSGGNIVGLTLDAVLPIAAQGLAGVGDMATLADILVTDQPFGVAIRLNDGSVLQKQITEATESNRVTFTTPFADTGVVVAGLLVGAGLFGREFRRCRVMAVEPTGIETRRLVLADEAADLFA